MLSCWLTLGIALLGSNALAQALPPQTTLHPIEAFRFGDTESNNSLILRQPVQTGEPFTVAGPQGLIVGQQQGEFEAWLLPVKLLSHFTVEASVEGYPVPIDMNSMAREIEVRPERTTITYSHIALTLRQTIFAPEGMPQGTGAFVLFQIDSLRPVDLTFRFTAEMRKMWPALNSGPPSAEWVAQGRTGFYALHTDIPDFVGAVALPGATSGILAPYQERPQVHPLEFRLHVDPSTDRNKSYPLLMAFGKTKETTTNQALAAKLSELNQQLPALYTAHVARNRKQEQDLTEIVTPDSGLDKDFAWAETSIGQLRAATPDGGAALVAGYYASGDSARPGFGWFFGRDALYTLYAVNSYGNFGLSCAELQFLLKHQREDGKMMHEYSQTANEVDWESLPYEYAAADATPLFLTAMLDYVWMSGDLNFLKGHRDAVMKAWQFETTHDADGDGIYDNAQGTGWVESWPPGMPKQEIYLALLDEQASRAVARMSELLGDTATATEGKARARKLHETIEREYYKTSANDYGFSWNDGKLDSTETIYPAIAWWNLDVGSKVGDGVGLDHSAASLRRWASHDFATDWGLRDVAASDPMYDGISYHQGSVWPLFTGWAAMAQYRSGNTLAGYQSTMQNADLTTAQDVGAVTELLSGDFFEPFGRSTSHQLWSSAMVVTPVMRGLFGIDLDGLHRILRITPHLPADWDSAEIKRLRAGHALVDLTYRRDKQTMVVTLHEAKGGESVQLTGTEPTTRGPQGQILRIPLPAVEVSVGHRLPLRGARTAQMKVLGEKVENHSLQLELEGMAGTESVLHVRRNDSGVSIKASGAVLDGDDLHVNFAAGTGYQKQSVSLAW